MGSEISPSRVSMEDAVGRLLVEMRRVLETVRLWVLGAVAAALLAGIPAQANAALASAPTAFR